MGEPFAPVLLDTSTLSELSDRCDELQARSARLHAEAAAMTTRLSTLDQEIAMVIAMFNTLRREDEDA